MFEIWNLEPLLNHFFINHHLRVPERHVPVAERVRGGVNNDNDSANNNHTDTEILIMLIMIMIMIMIIVCYYYYY